jgi:hypothetical protein
MDRDRVQLHEACVIPFRHAPAGIQFCLISQRGSSRWEFPKVAQENQNGSQADVLQLAAEALGLHGRLHDSEALGQFEAARGSELHSVRGYLLQVDHSDEIWPLQQDCRRLWCLAEEARVRIRRKPLRRFIDLALHSSALRGTAPAHNGMAPQYSA